MEKQFDIINFIKKLLEFSPRLGINERKSAELIMSVLKTGGIGYAVQEFENQIPVAKKTRLEADGRVLEAKASCFVSGTLEDKHSLISSLIPSRFCLTHPNINFNPECRAISLANFYFAPAVAISRGVIPKIIGAKKVRAEIEIDPYRFESWNILVGNVETPKKIFFSHYDSIETGATDNASGVAVLMQMIFDRPAALSDHLFVFCGSEELSYDQPTYWGKGYRAFEQGYKGIMERAERLIVIDCAGNGKNVMDSGDYIKYLAFPIKNTGKWNDKIFILHADLAKVNRVYHSALDDINQLDKKSLLAATGLLGKEFPI